MYWACTVWALLMLMHGSSILTNDGHWENVSQGPESNAHTRTEAPPTSKQHVKSSAVHTDKRSILKQCLQILKHVMNAEIILVHTFMTSALGNRWCVGPRASTRDPGKRRVPHPAPHHTAVSPPHTAGTITVSRCAHG